MTIRGFGLLCLLIIFSYAGVAQVDSDQNENPDRSNPEENSEFWDKVYFGGNFWVQFGTLTYVDISPLVGYRFTENFSAGPGITYQYLRYKRLDYSTSVYGGRVFARHTIARQFFVEAQYENLNVEFPVVVNGSFDYVREWVPGAFLGGGIYQPIGRRAAVILSVLYNFTYVDGKSPYNSPWVFNVGFTL